MHLWVALAIAWLDTPHPLFRHIHSASATGVGLREKNQFALFGDELDGEDASSAIWKETDIQFVKDLLTCNQLHIIRIVDQRYGRICGN